MEDATKKYHILIPSLVSVIMLVSAVFPVWPDAYFTVLKWIVCVTAALIAFVAQKSGRKLWFYLCCAVAIFFNPFYMVYIPRFIWSIVDVAAAAIIFLSVSNTGKTVKTD